VPWEWFLLSGFGKSAKVPRNKIEGC
jgi:hypothetical protein